MKVASIFQSECVFASNTATVANQQIHLLQQETTQCKTSINDLIRNQTFSAELRRLNQSNTVTTASTSSQELCSCQNDISQLSRKQMNISATVIYIAESSQCLKKNSIICKMERWQFSQI